MNSLTGQSPRDQVSTRQNRTAPLVCTCNTSRRLVCVRRHSSFSRRVERPVCTSLSCVIWRIGCGRNLVSLPRPSGSLSVTSRSEDVESENYDTRWSSLVSDPSMTDHSIHFEVQAREGEARAGILTTRRGLIETPVFMPVGTAGTVKGIRFEELESPDLNARIILGNTYHLWLRPGIDTIRACGGLHRFTGWDRALLTDSGGFQVWSLGASRKISEEGTEFRSHVDGSLQFLSPEVSMEVQAALGSDIVMVFDECAPGDSLREEARQSMELTARWARRSRQRFDSLQEEDADTGKKNGQGLSGRQALFGIVQGGTHLDLRRESLQRTMELNFDGYAIGGLSVGEEKRVMWDVVGEVAPLMPADRPRYLMGVGTPEDVVEA